MVELSVIEGGREQMAQQALSVVLTGNDAKCEELLRTMRPGIPAVAVISGTLAGEGCLPDAAA